MPRNLSRSLFWLSALGFLISLFWNLSLRTHLLPPSGPEPRPAFFVLFMGVFAVFLPTMFSLKRFQKETRIFDFGFRIWKYLVKGAPAWSVWVAGASFVYAFVNFFSMVPLGNGPARDGDVNFELMGSGHCMAFYAIAAVLNWAAVRRVELGIDWVCERGHPLAPSDKFCSECGAPAKASAGYRRSGPVQPPAKQVPFYFNL